MSEFLAQCLLYIISSQEIKDSDPRNNIRWYRRKWSSLRESLGFQNGLERIGGSTIISSPQPILYRALL